MGTGDRSGTEQSPTAPSSGEVSERNVEAAPDGTSMSCCRRATASISSATLYFGGHDITLPIVVLGIYVLVGAVVVRMLCWRGDTRSTGGRQAMTRSLQSLPFPPPDGPRGGGVRCRWPVTTALVGEAVVPNETLGATAQDD
jgi:hypothetical protein